MAFKKGLNAFHITTPVGKPAQPQQRLFTARQGHGSIALATCFWPPRLMKHKHIQRKRLAKSTLRSGNFFH